MFTLIQAADFQKNDKLLTATFKLRKKVFADQLNWDVRLCPRDVTVWTTKG